MFDFFKCKILLRLDDIAPNMKWDIMGIWGEDYSGKDHADLYTEDGDAHLGHKVEILDGSGREA